MLLENRKVSFEFNEFGTLVKLTNKRTGHYVTDKQGAKGVSLLVDKNTDDIWESRPYSEGAVNIDLSAITATLEKCVAEDGEELTVTHKAEIEGVGGTVDVVQKIVLETNADLLKWSIRFVNNLDAGVVVSATVLVDGFVDHDYALFWPLQDGNLMEGALKSIANGSQIKHDVRYNYSAQFSENDSLSESRFSCTYPIPCSVQFLTLHNNEECFYFGYHDKMSTYKQFIFEKAGKAGMVVWPFIAKGESFYVDPLYVGCLEGDWHEGADVYYDWLVNESGKVRKMSPLAQKFKGMACFQAVSFPGEHYHLKYVEDAPAKTILAPSDVKSRCINTDCVGTNITTFEQAGQFAYENSGIDTTLFMGWHRGGFDVFYPDYEILDCLGGKEGLKKCIDDMHAKGLKALFYTNIHLADTTGKWYNIVDENGRLRGENSAVWKGNGDLYHERYAHTTNHLYTAMCPKDPEWQKQIVKVIESVRELGADGAFFDQVMTSPAYLCYNKAHGHRTPATAFEDGYQELLTKINDTYKKYGDDFVFSCEGIGDCYMNQIDIMGMLWFRKWGNAKAPYMRPEVLRYCIPAPVLGMQSYGEIGDNLYAYGFCMFAPPMTYPYIFDLTKRWVALCDKYPEVYHHGRFLEHLGVSGLPENTEYGVCISANKKSCMIHIFNSNMFAKDFDITINKAKWKDNLISDDFAVINAETGDRIDCREGICKFSLQGKGKIALLIR